MNKDVRDIVIGKGDVYALNSCQLTASQLHRIAESLQLPLIQMIRQIIEETVVLKAAMVLPPLLLQRPQIMITNVVWNVVYSFYSYGKRVICYSCCKKDVQCTIERYLPSSRLIYHKMLLMSLPGFCSKERLMLLFSCFPPTQGETFFLSVLL